MLCKQCFRNFRSKISKIYNQRIAAGSLDIFQRLHHVDFTLYDADRTFIDVFCRIFLLVGFHQISSSRYGKALRKTVSAHRYNS